MEPEIKQIEPSNRMFKIVRIVATGVLIFLVAQIYFQQKTLENQNSNQVTVSGEGKILESSSAVSRK